MSVPRSNTSESRVPAAVSSDPGIAGGEPVLSGTRIRVALLYAMEVKAGMSLHNIAATYPHLTPGQIESALAFARANEELMEECLRADEQEEGSTRVRVWDVDHVFRWIDDVAASARDVAPSPGAVARTKRLVSELGDIAGEHMLFGLREPQVDLDPEGGLDLVWAHKGKGRFLVFTVDEGRPEGKDTDVMIVEGESGCDLEGVTRQQLLDVLLWYLSPDGESWEVWKARQGRAIP